MPNCAAIRSLLFAGQRITRVSNHPFISLALAWTTPLFRQRRSVNPLLRHLPLAFDHNNFGPPTTTIFNGNRILPYLLMTNQQIQFNCLSPPVTPCRVHPRPELQLIQVQTSTRLQQPPQLQAAEEAIGPEYPVWE